MNILKQNFPTPVALALGSNAAGSKAIFRMACQLLQSHGFAVERMAQIIITKPVDCPPGTPDFYNSALTGTFNGSAMELLEITQSIEQTLGRPVDHGFHLPRSLDIDIIILDVSSIIFKFMMGHYLSRAKVFPSGNIGGNVNSKSSS